MEGIASIFIGKVREVPLDTKRDTLERMSHAFGVELGRTVEKPWPPVASPRELEGPNEVGRDLVFQPSLPAITY